MAAATRVVVLEEASIPKGHHGWVLCFQWCRYDYAGGEKQDFGYRFIWRYPPAAGSNARGDLQPARGQARLPSLSDIRTLVDLAVAAGWGDHQGTDDGHGVVE